MGSGSSIWISIRDGSPLEMSLWLRWVSGQLGDRPVEIPSPQGGARDLTLKGFLSWYEPRETWLWADFK